jgi:hypothetical protein
VLPRHSFIRGQTRNSDFQSKSGASLAGVYPCEEAAPQIWYGAGRHGWGKKGNAMKGAVLFWLLLALMLPAKAQQQGSTITLSCNGTAMLTATSAADQKPDPITNLGIMVNLTNRTVTLNQYVLPITIVNATLVAFDGQQNRGVKGASFDLSGAIDRVTGQTEVDWMYENVGNNSHWELTCRPATRLF